MAEWICSACGYVRDSRCKPRKCPQCGSSEGFDRAEEVRGETKGKPAAPRKSGKGAAGGNLSEKGKGSGKASVERTPAGKKASR